MSLYHNLWTAAEHDLIRQHYATAAEADLMALLPGRTWRATGIQAGKLGVRRMQVWRPDEDAVVREFYPTSGKARMEALLPGRAWDSILCRAQRLGVWSARRWTAAQLATLYAEFPAHGSYHVAALIGRTPASVMKRAVLLGVYRVHPEKPKPAPKVAKAPKPPKPPKAPKVAKPKRVKAAPAPKPAKVAKPAKPVKPVAVKRSPGTPVLNAQKALTIQRRTSAQKPVPVTAEEIRKLPYAHPGRLAYSLHGAAGYLQWQQSQPNA